MKKAIVGIIGIAGAFGQLLEKEFLKFDGCSQVIGHDPKEPLTSSLEGLVSRSDVVVFAVPMHVMSRVIQRCIPYSRSNQLWMDVGSLKLIPAQKMRESRAEVVGMHPMFSPQQGSFSGQHVWYADVRLDLWKDWFCLFQESCGARFHRTSPEEHDENMAIMQALTHAMLLTMGATLSQRDVETVKRCLPISTPIYEIAFSLIGRILAQNPGVYADIQMMNPLVPEVLDHAIKQLERLRKQVIAQDRDAFISDFLDTRQHFGDATVHRAFQMFEALIPTVSAFRKLG